MPVVFADAGYWIALVDERDSLHQHAQRATQRRERLSIVTTEMVLVEVFSHMARGGAGNRRKASGMLAALRANARVEIVPQSSEQFNAAADRFAAREDQRWSLTDCASFLVMEERGITEAFAYDRDFEQAGFAALLRDDESLA